MGHRGVVAIEGELEILRKKYLDLRRAIAKTEYETQIPRTIHTHSESHYYHYFYNQPPVCFLLFTFLRANLLPKVYPGTPLQHIVVPLPPHQQTHVFVNFAHKQNDAFPQDLE